MIWFLPLRHSVADVIADKVKLYSVSYSTAVKYLPTEIVIKFCLDLFQICFSEKTEESLPEETQYSYVSSSRKNLLIMHYFCTNNKLQITYFGLVSSFWNLVVRQPCTLKVVFINGLPLQVQRFDTSYVYVTSAGKVSVWHSNMYVLDLQQQRWCRRDLRWASNSRRVRSQLMGWFC